MSATAYWDRLRGSDSLPGVKICSRCSELFADDARYCANDGTSLEPSTDRFLGRTIASRYRLVRRLGAGGMSLVYLARHELIARLSALKILRPELSAITEHRERFLREARAVNRINHENIVEITDVGESDGVAYLVMEYVDGEPLFSWVQRGPLPWEVAARIGMQISSALARAHQMGIVHRDLKPENILLVSPEARTRKGAIPQDVKDVKVKLTDFGIAKMFDEPTLTLNEQLFGTPGYIAPEYVGGLPIDGRADIYSLAVVIYEMITGVLPFDGRGASELLLKPLTTSPVPLSVRRGGFPTELEALLMRCLSREPADRPADAFAVHDALVDVVQKFGSGRESAARLPALRDSSGRVSAVPSSGAVRTEQATELDMTIQGSSRRTERNPREALEELDLLVDELRSKGEAFTRPLARAADYASVAREMIERIERAERVVAEQQATVDFLEARGREFRTNLGHAIDVLVHDRSRAREKLEAFRNAGSQGSFDAARVIADLDFQIEALQAQLRAKNDAFEDEVVEAAGRLEGSLSALRALHREVSRTIQDGISVVERARDA